MKLERSAGTTLLSSAPGTQPVIAPKSIAGRKAAYHRRRSTSIVPSNPAEQVKLDTIAPKESPTKKLHHRRRRSTSIAQLPLIAQLKFDTPTRSRSVPAAAERGNNKGTRHGGNLRAAARLGDVQKLATGSANVVASPTLSSFPVQRAGRGMTRSQTTSILISCAGLDSMESSRSFDASRSQVQPGSSSPTRFNESFASFQFIGPPMLWQPVATLSGRQANRNVGRSYTLDERKKQNRRSLGTPIMARAAEKERMVVLPPRSQSVHSNLANTSVPSETSRKGVSMPLKDEGIAPADMEESKRAMSAQFKDEELVPPVNTSNLKRGIGAIASGLGVIAYLSRNVMTESVGTPTAHRKAIKPSRRDRRLSL